MSVSDPRRVVVQATNESGDTLQPGMVVQVININTDDTNTTARRVVMKRHHGVTTSDQTVPTAGVILGPIGRQFLNGEAVSVCIQGACFAFCKADGGNIDSDTMLVISDAGKGGAEPYTFTNNVAHAAALGGGAAGALPGTVDTVIAALRARASAPTGGPANNGVNLLAAGNDDVLPVIVYNNPGSNAE